MNKNHIAFVLLLLVMLCWMHCRQLRRESDALRKTPVTDWPKQAEMVSLYLQRTMKWL